MSMSASIQNPTDTASPPPPALRFAVRDTDSQGAGFAALFVQALRLDPTLETAWNAELAVVKDLAEAARAAALAQWLSAQGYPCTAADLKTAFQATIPTAQQPDLDARRFAADLLTNSALRLSWATAINALTSAVSPSLTTLDAFLTTNGYQTTAARVMNAIADSVASGQVAAFVGGYGTTTMLDLQGATVATPPVLLVNMEGVALGSEQILGTWDGATYSWSASDLQDTAGSLQFDKSATDSYVGPTFTGTVTYPDPKVGRFPAAGQVTFSGRLGAIPAGAATPVDTGSSSGSGFSQAQLDWITGVGTIVAMVGVTVPIIALVLQALDFKRGVAERAKADAEKAEKDARAREAAGTEVEVAPADLPAALDPIGVVGVEVEMAELRAAPNPAASAALDAEVVQRNGSIQDEREQADTEDEDALDDLFDI